MATPHASISLYPGKNGVDVVKKSIATNNYGKRSLKGKLLDKTGARRRANTEAVDLAAAASGQRNDLLPTLRYEQRKIADLKYFKNKVRIAKPEHVADIVTSLKRFGQCQPVLITGEGKVIDGEAVIAAAQQLGLDELRVLVIDHLSEPEARALRVAMNKLGENGEWDLDQLKIETIELIDLSMPIIGFSSQTLDIIHLDDAGENASAADELPVAATDKPVVSRPGDIIRLSAHRALRGDALDPANYPLLLAGNSITMIGTDQPYNVKIEGFVSGLGKTKHKDFAMASGEMSREEFQSFTETFLAAAKPHLIDGALVYLFIDHRGIDTVMAASRAVGLKHVATCVWDKGVGGMGGLYRQAFELVVVNVNGKTPAINNVRLGKHGRDRTSMWRYPGANRRGSSANQMLGSHPTAKPVEAIADMILDASNRGDVVFDPFLGSGTTIIAAEKTGRVAHGFELDGRYFDLLVRRWEAFTGRDAIHEQTGLTFTELAAKRAAEAHGNTADENTD